MYDMDRPPWWKRCVREDFLLLNFSDASFFTAFDSRDVCSTYEFQFKDVLGLFQVRVLECCCHIILLGQFLLLVKLQEGDSENPVTILRAHADEKSGHSLPNGGKGFEWSRFVSHIRAAVNYNIYNYNIKP